MAAEGRSERLALVWGCCHFGLWVLHFAPRSREAAWQVRWLDCVWDALAKCHMTKKKVEVSSDGAASHCVRVGALCSAIGATNMVLSMVDFVLLDGRYATGARRRQNPSMAAPACCISDRGAIEMSSF